MAEEEENDLTLVEDPFLSIPKIYTNAIKVSWGYHDFQLILGTSCFNSIANEPYHAVVPQSIVHMSPQHFKQLAKIINEQLGKYEKEIGTIPDPPNPPELKKA